MSKNLQDYLHDDPSLTEEISREEIAAMLAAIHDDEEDRQLADAMQTLKGRGYITEDGEPITWITGNDGAQVAVRNMPVDKMQQICAIIGGEPCKDTISRQAAIDEIRKDVMGGLNYESILKRLPPVQHISRWIPITYRPMTDEEKKYYAERTGYDEEDLDVMIDSEMPDDGETVLITDRLGNVETDTYCDDSDGSYFECNCDMDDVKAWMRLPKPYTGEDSNV